MQPVKLLSYIFAVIAVTVPVQCAPVTERAAGDVLNTIAGALGGVGGGIPAKVLSTIAGGLGGEIYPLNFNTSV